MLSEMTYFVSGET